MLRRLLVPTCAALGGLALIALVLGDPRGAPAFDRAWWTFLAGFALAIAVGVAAWALGRSRSIWLLPPAVLLAVTGGLCGWIAAAEFTGEPNVPARAAGRVAFMLAFTAVGMVLPPWGLAAIAGLFRPRDRART